MNISEEIWIEILRLLKKYEIPYTSHYESRDVQKAIEYPDVITVQDKHIQINLIIPDYFGDSK